MNDRLIKYISFSVGMILSLFGGGKIFSCFSTAPILQTHDLIFLVPYKYTFLIVGAIEIFIGLQCILCRKYKLNAIVILWLSFSFLFYRLGILWIAAPKPCYCLGSLTDTLRITPETADAIAKTFLGYMFLGACCMLLSEWYRNRKKSFC